MLAYLNYINFIVINIMYFDYLKSYLDFRYVVLFFVLFILVLIGIYKIKFQFWSRQPVFHIHNLKYWLIPPGIIQHHKPEKDKFYEINVKFTKIIVNLLLIVNGRVEKKKYCPFFRQRVVGEVNHIGKRTSIHRRL